MHIFIHEFITGGGLYRTQWWPPPESLLREGRAMLGAIARDFGALPGVRVTTLADARLPAFIGEGCEVQAVASAADFDRAFSRLAAAADWTIVIAPETDGLLAALAQQVVDVGGQMLGPSVETICLTADKQRTAEWLTNHRVATPRGVLIPSGARTGESVAFPAVLKPLDGAGSMDVRLVRSAEELPPVERACRLEAFHRGRAASDLCLCGPGGAWALPPCWQHLSDDGAFAYRGGSYPLPPALSRRARWLALAAVQSLPSPFGYLGVDLILGDDPTGRDDVVIEINPRLTTSYVGLRAASRVNLAAAMLAVAAGREPELKWRKEPVQFTADGEVTTDSPVF